MATETSIEDLRARIDRYLAVEPSRALPPLVVPPRRVKFLDDHALGKTMVIQHVPSGTIVKALGTKVTLAQGMRELMRQGLRAHHTVGRL